MLRNIFLTLIAVAILNGGNLTLNKEKSEVYYDAKKEQFFMTMTVIGTNKALKGDLTETDSGYKGTLKVEASLFDSDNGKRDEHVREDYLGTDKNPFISFEYTIISNVAKGIITIAGISKEISFPVVVKDSDSSVYIEGNIRIKYTDFGIETPSNPIISAHEDLLIGGKLSFNK